MSMNQALAALLIVATAVAPLITGRFLLRQEGLFDRWHVLAFTLATASLVFDIALLGLGWLLFCVGTLVRFAYPRLRRPQRLHLVQAVPFVFSVAGAVWFVAGSNDLRLLGYDKAFSYYAALHSTVLGWLVVGCMACLATYAERLRKFYEAAVLVCLCAFFLIAFGIDGAPIIKPIGVAGITLMVGLSQILLIRECADAKPAAFFALVSFLGFAYTMLLAWRNELGIPLGYGPYGLRPMVSLHGIINGLLVGPCMALAVYLRFRHAVVGSQRQHGSHDAF